MGRPKKSSGSFQLKPNETLTGKDYIEYMKSVIKASNDPVWFIKDILGFPLYPVQEEIIYNYYQHKYNTNLPELKKLIMIMGQRSGKTAMASTIMAYELFELIRHEKPAEYFNLAPGAMLAVTCVAVSRDQAHYGVFSNMQNMLEKNEWFQQWFDDLVFRDQRIESEQRQVIAQVLAANVATAAGYTNKCVIFDELDLFQQSLTSKISADLVYTKLCNSTQTFKERGKIVAISSLQYVDGLMTSIYKDGLDEHQTLAIKKCTWEVNPTITEEQLRDEYKYNMTAFFRDFANQPGVASGLQFPEGVILNPSMENVLLDDYIPEYEGRHPYQHVMCIDPAYKNDSFGVATGYRKHNHIFIDGVRKFTNMDNQYGDAFIKPSDIRRFIERKIPELNVTGFVHDVYMYPEILESVKYKFGIQPVLHQVSNADYNRWRELQDKVGELRNYELQVVYDSDLQREANRLITKRLDSGKVRTDHTWRESKDVSDTVANCIWYMTGYQPDDFTYKPVGYHILG